MKTQKKLGFGFMRLPVLDENDRSTVDLEQVKKMVDLYMDRGFTYFDTAHRYNDEASEPALRECLVQRYPRDTYEITDKITMNYIKREEDQRLFFMKQLGILGLDYFDNYLIHNMGSVFYPLAQKYHTFEFVRQMREEGYITGNIGISFHGTADVLQTILCEHPEIEIVQLQINYLDWEDESIQSRKCYETALKYGKKIIVMEPVKGGTLMNLPEDILVVLKAKAPDVSPASWAIRFAAGLEGVTVVLSGMSTPGQVEENTSFMQGFLPLGRDEIWILQQAATQLKKLDAVPCTNCRYCVTECPMQIAIPSYLSLYNNYHRLENTSYLHNQSVYYRNLTETNGKASDCIQCGLCEKNCPQRIAIREKLKDVATLFE